MAGAQLAAGKRRGGLREKEQHQFAALERLAVGGVVEAVDEGRDGLWRDHQ